MATADAPALSLAGLGGATAPPAGFARRPMLPTLKLGTYDGRTSLEAFLEKFNNTGAVPVDETRAAEASRRVDRLESALKEYRRKLDQVRQEDVQLRRDLREGTQRGRRQPSEATAAADQGQRLSSSGPSAPYSTPLVPSSPPPSSGGGSRVCYGCGSPGHVVKDCPSGRHGARGTQRPEQSETYTEMDFCGTRHRCFLANSVGVRPNCLSTPLVGLCHPVQPGVASTV